ncbi:transposase [Gammaproteobacteria bacterium]
MDLLFFLACLAPCLNATTLRRLARVVAALLTMTGRVTMLGISRWTEAGGSYRTVQRFFNTLIPWEKVQWHLIRRHLMRVPCVILLTADEVVTPKAGRHTHGIGRFFSSIYGKPLPSLCHLCLSLTSVNDRVSYPVMTLPVIPPEKPPTAPSRPTVKRGRGRPKGSRNQVRTEVELTAFQRFLRDAIQALQVLVGADLPLLYFVYDGALGHNAGVQLVRHCGLHLISKLRHDSALYFPYEGLQSGRGPRKKYGARLDYGQLPEHFRKFSVVEDNLRTDIYQMSLRHKKFTELLNVVIIIKTNLKTLKSAHVLLFSSDLALAWNELMDYYSLRFQIEFNFRDAKQFWGLDDFMSVNERPAINAANLAFFMVNVSHLLRRQTKFVGMSIIDLKAVVFQTWIWPVMFHNLDIFQTKTPNS